MNPRTLDPTWCFLTFLKEFDEKNTEFEYKLEQNSVAKPAATECEGEKWWQAEDLICIFSSGRVQNKLHFQKEYNFKQSIKVAVNVVL